MEIFIILLAVFFGMLIGAGIAYLSALIVWFFIYSSN